MLTHWNKLFNTNCKVIEVGGRTVYPIFKVGLTSLMADATTIYTNKQISKCRHIDILFRDPGERFVSGVNQYCKENSLDVEDTWELIEQGTLVDRHFVPQYVWLLHLHRFYKGTVTLLPFKDIKKITKIHKRYSNKRKTPVALLKSFVEVDYELIENHLNKPILLEKLIRKYKNVLS